MPNHLRLRQTPRHCGVLSSSVRSPARRKVPTHKHSLGWVALGAAQVAAAMTLGYQAYNRVRIPQTDINNLLQDARASVGMIRTLGEANLASIRCIELQRQSAEQQIDSLNRQLDCVVDLARSS